MSIVRIRPESRAGSGTRISSLGAWRNCISVYASPTVTWVRRMNLMRSPNDAGQLKAERKVGSLHQRMVPVVRLSGSSIRVLEIEIVDTVPRGTPRKERSQHCYGKDEEVIFTFLYAYSDFLSTQ